MTLTEFRKRPIHNVLAEAKTIVIIGCSQKEYRTSHSIAGYLKSAGYKIIPVNPNVDSEILGEKVLDTIQDLSAETKIDIVDIFRNKEFTADMVREVAAWSAQTGQKPVVWTQLDVSSPESERIAEENELDYIKNRCIYVEHSKYFQSG